MHRENKSRMKTNIKEKFADEVLLKLQEKDW